MVDSFECQCDHGSIIFFVFQSLILPCGDILGRGSGVVKCGALSDFNIHGH